MKMDEKRSFSTKAVKSYYFQKTISLFQGKKFISRLLSDQETHLFFLSHPGFFCSFSFCSFFCVLLFCSFFVFSSTFINLTPHPIYHAHADISLESLHHFAETSCPCMFFFFGQSSFLALFCGCAAETDGIRMPAGISEFVQCTDRVVG